jgi:O-antigen/teichoic acid export membrane protein
MAALNPLPRWQRRGIHASVIALLGSGLAWLAVHYTVGAGASELPHWSESWLMKLHGAATMASLFFFGCVMAAHVPRGWRMGRQRRTGLALWTLVALLVISGYALYYVAPEAWRPAIGISHAVLGSVLALLLLWHRRGSQRAGLAHPRTPVHPHHGQRPRHHHVGRG